MGANSARRIVRFCVFFLGVVLCEFLVSSRVPGSKAQEPAPAVSFDNVNALRPLTSMVTGSPSTLFFNRDGSLLVTSTYGKIELWRVQTGEKVSFSGPGAAFGLSTDETLVALYDDEQTRLWNIAEDREVVAVQGGFAALSSDNTRLLTSGPAATLWLWDAQTGAQLALLDQAERHFPALFSPDGAYFVFTGLTGNVQIWDAAAGVRYVELSFNARNAIFQPGSSLLALTNGDEAFLWDVETGQIHERFNVPKTKVAFSPDGLFLLNYSDEDSSGTISGDAYIFDPSGKRLGQFTGGYSSNSKFQFSPDGSKIAWFNQGYRDQDSQLQIWDTTTRQMLALPEEMTLNVGMAAFGPDSSWLLVGQYETFSRMVLNAWNLTAGTRQTIPLLGGKPTLAPDGTALAAVVNNVVLLYGIPTPDRPVGRVLIPAEIPSEGVNLRSAPDANAPVIGTASGKVLASGQHGDFIYLADKQGWVRAGSDYITLSGALPADFLPQIDPAEAVAYVPTPTPTHDWTYLLPTPSPTSSVPTPTLPPLATTAPSEAESASTLSAHPDQIRLLEVLPGSLQNGLAVKAPPDPSAWNWTTWTGYKLPPLEKNTLYLVSPDGTLLAYAAGTAVHVWDFQTARDIAVFEGHTEPVQQMIFSPNGDLLTTSAVRTDYHDASDPTIRIWDIRGQIQRALFTFPWTEYLSGLQFNRAGTLLAAAYGGGLTYIVDANTGGEQFVLGAPAGYTVFSPDDKVIATVNPKNTFRLWALTSGDTLAILAGEPYSPDYQFDNLIFSPDGQGAIAFSHRLHSRYFYGGHTEIVLWNLASKTRSAVYDGACSAAFAPDGQKLFVTERKHMLRVYDVATGQDVASFPVDWCGDLVLSPDGRLLALGTAVLDLTTWTLHAIPGTSYAVDSTAWPNYRCYNEGYQSFSADGSLLAVSSGDTTMIYGLPTAQHPEEMPLAARVMPSGVTLHALPRTDEAVIGTVSGEISLGGLQGQSFYVPDRGGWVWSDYIDLGDHTVNDLPYLWPQCQN
jgi:WD40 repeat protein